MKPGTARRTLLLAKPYSKILSLFLTLVVLDAAVGIANPLIYRDIIDRGILAANAALVLRLALLAGGLGLLDVSLNLAISYLSAYAGVRILLSLRIKLFDHIQQMSLAFFMRARTGALVNRLNADVAGAQNAFTDILSNVVGNTLTVSLILIAMFILCWQLTLATVILLPLFLFPARFWGRKVREITKQSYDRSAEMNNFVVERFNVAGAQLVKLFGCQQDESRTFAEKASRVSAIELRRSVYGRLFFTSLMIMAVFATSLAYGWGGALAVGHRLDIGAVVAFVSYLARLYGPLVSLSNVQLNLMATLVSFERVFEVLDLAPAIQENHGAVLIPDGPVKISFDHVCFRYPTASEVSIASLESVPNTGKTVENTVLHDVTFTAEPGQLVALVGPSGGGKTTVTHLIARLYDVQAGCISINGTDVRDAKLDALHKRIGVVTQDTHLFHDTVRGNLLYAKPNATDLEIREVLRAVQILSRIESLPQGLDTLLGERGYRLSGGERQRLAIARLLLKAPDIVILDEATAHLDAESEAAVQRALDIALFRRTSIVIAHRLSTIRKADVILVIQQGSIVERGTHAALLERHGAYAALYRLQFTDQSTETLTRY